MTDISKYKNVSLSKDTYEKINSSVQRVWVMATERFLRIKPQI